MKKLWIDLNTRVSTPRRVNLKPPKRDEVAVEVPGEKCQCNAKPLIVQGAGMRICPDARHDTYMADAICVRCGGHVGILYAKVDTLFGLEEDERVASMGVKIY